MSAWTLDDLTDALDGSLRGARPGGRELLGGISTDTRSIAPGDTFVALVGERFNGHDFLEAAVARGAKAVVVSDPVRAASLGVPAYQVADTTVALGALARWRRRMWGGRVIAVAGSNGKTSTRAMLAAVLGRGLRVHATKANLNNQIGVPLTLLDLPMDAEVAVVEMGTNHPGEIAILRDIAEPDVAVVTSIGEEHLEGFGSIGGVLREEVSACAGVALAVTPASQPEVAAAARPVAALVVEAGLDSGSVCPDAWGVDGDGRGWLMVDGVRGSLPVVGVHNLRNASLVLAVGRAFGLAGPSIVEGLAAMEAPAMRSTLVTLGTLQILSDAYNANPASMREALATLDAIDTPRQRVAILGSMLELGPQGPSLHDDLARRALASRAHVIGAVGAFAEAFARVAPGEGRVVSAPDPATLWPQLVPRLAPDALILLKGSRGVRLEQLLGPLAQHAGAAAPSSHH